MGAEGTGAGAGTTVVDPVVVDPVVPATKETPPADPAPPAKPETPAKTSIVTAPPEKTEPTEPKDKAPEKYELTLPEDSLLDKSAIERTAAEAKEQGLSNDAAQEFLNRQSQALTDHVDKQSEDWIAEIKADKEIGGDNYGESVEMARRVVNRFGNDALRESLNKYGYGNHPEVVRFCANIGKAMGEDKLISGAVKPASPKPKTAADRLYGGKPETAEA